MLYILFPVLISNLFAITSFSSLATFDNILNLLILLVFNSSKLTIIPSPTLILSISPFFNITSPVVKVISCIFKNLAPSRVIPFLLATITSRLSFVNASKTPFISVLLVLVTLSKANLAGSFKFLLGLIIPAI